eukprot:7872836-Ditylum_brightwellii.AAC.1
MLNALRSQLLILHCGHPGHKQVQKYGITVQCPDNIEKAIKQIRASQKEIKNILKKAKGKRDESNRQLTSIHALTDKVTEEKALKSIINAEKNVNSMEEDSTYSQKQSLSIHYISQNFRKLSTDWRGH